jgi:hypothetical protein
MEYRYFFTKDGAIQGVETLNVTTSFIYLQNIGQMYEGCHCWAKLGNTTWYSCPAAGFAFTRMEAHQSWEEVPDYVRMAEALL